MNKKSEQDSKHFAIFEVTYKFLGKERTDNAQMKISKVAYDMLLRADKVKFLRVKSNGI